MTDFQKTIEAMVSLRASAGRHTPPDLLARLTQSCGTGNIHIVRNAMRRPIGYFAWIRVCKESFRMIRATNSLPTLHFENNEGYLPVIYDIVFLPGYELYCKEELRRFVRRRRLVGRHRSKRFRVLVPPRTMARADG